MALSKIHCIHVGTFKRGFKIKEHCPVWPYHHDYVTTLFFEDCFKVLAIIQYFCRAKDLGKLLIIFTGYFCGGLLRSVSYITLTLSGIIL